MTKHSPLLRRLTALVLALMMTAALPALAENTMDSELQAALTQEAVRMIKSTTTQELYSNANWDNTFTAFPEKYDLREVGVVAPIRNQKSWGTCWGFATIAACETSLLSDMGMTTQSFLDKYGIELNLSEKHLAWFGTSRMPELSLYPEGEYVYPGLESQAGEGLYRTDEAELGATYHYNNGGAMMYSSGIFAAGVGPVFEYIIPYKAADGSDSTASDWSLGDQERFGMTFELENSALLPSPAMSDADGHYLYNLAGTQAIKSELLAGKGVSIAYHADRALDPHARLNFMKDTLAALGLDATDEQTQFILDVQNGTFDMSTISDELFVFYMHFDLARNGIDPAEFTDDMLLAQKETVVKALVEATGAAQAADPTPDELAALEAAFKAAQAAARKQAEDMGLDYDAYTAQLQRVIDANNGTYINTENYAQYTDNNDASATHAVTIIGWDDSYSASNFLKGHQPPADGAWIVRNSWGTNYGFDGYFYLSYYDQSITGAETFDFVTENVDEHASQVDIMGYDYMQTESINTVQMQEYTSTANVFDMEDENILSYVSVLTADKSTDVTVEVYLLNENAASPVDGTMLDVVTKSYLFGGYHRIPLNYNFAVPAGSRISVVQVQRVPTDKGTVYAVPYSSNTNRKFLDAQNIFELDESRKTKTWFEGKIGKGESFVCLDGAWMDWSDVIAQLQENCSAASYLSYDNLNMKLYAYPVGEIKELHNLSEPIVFHGADAQVCSDCGYTIVEE